MPTIARVRCPHDKQHYKDNNGRSAYEVLGIVEISGVIKAVARHKKNDDKFLVAMSAADRAALTELLRSTYQNASVCALRAARARSRLACLLRTRTRDVPAVRLRYVWSAISVSEPTPRPPQDARYEEKYRVPDEYDELPPLKEDVLSPHTEAMISRIVTPVSKHVTEQHARTREHEHGRGRGDLGATAVLTLCPPWRLSLQEASFGASRTATS